MIKSPVLLVTFNRPDTTQIVFDSIKKAKPLKLYIFNDGPRNNNEKDLQARIDILKIIDQVDWDCQVYKNFPETNHGCGLGVSGAISWAFDNEDRLIVLEDDTVPGLPFYYYCDYLLEKYKNDNRICMISGNNFSEDKTKASTSYYFSKYGHIWGWATWKRVWEKFDYNMKDWPQFKNTNQLLNVFHDKKEQRYFLNTFDKTFKNKEKTFWGMQWFYCRIKNYGLSILPKSNLVTNIGTRGVHTSEKSETHFVHVSEDYMICDEPEFIHCDLYYDKHHFRQIINNQRSLVFRIFRKIIKVFKKYL